jgi:hypothetical protein
MKLWVSQRRVREKTIRSDVCIWNIVKAYRLDSIAMADGWVSGHSNDPMGFTVTRKGTDHPKRRINIEHSVSIWSGFICKGRWWGLWAQ